MLSLYTAIRDFARKIAPLNHDATQVFQHKPAGAGWIIFQGLVVLSLLRSSVKTIAVENELLLRVSYF